MYVDKLVPERPDLLERFAPPYEFTADMLFVLALAPTAPLRLVFPGAPFVSFLGKTPLVLWFGRVLEACSGDAGGERRCISGALTVPYDELSVMALLRGPAAFTLAIHTSGELSVQIGRRYGMPKQLTPSRFAVAAGWVESEAECENRLSFVRARLLGSGRWLGRLVSLLWPRCDWPVRFPSGSSLRVQILAMPRVQLAYVASGQLDLDVPWLRRAVGFFPLGVFVSGLRMQLPPPPAAS